MLYNSYRKYLTKKFGKPVLKIPINGGFSCPNRDGTKSSSGCYFCDNVSFSPAANKRQSPQQQLRSAINRAGSRFHAFLPYLQPFSNTYGPIEMLRTVYQELLDTMGVIGLAIGTRPDCFNESVFECLDDLNRRSYICVELGLQSSHDKTLKMINRGHTFDDFCTTVEKLSQLKIETVAHVMIGLPGESPEMMLETARIMAMLPIQGIKIHQLMVIKGTPLEALYIENKLEVLTLEQYAELLVLFLSFLRPNQHIHRIMADSRTDLGLIAPLWSQCKTESLQYIHSYMNKCNALQGSNHSL